MTADPLVSPGAGPNLYQPAISGFSGTVIPVSASTPTGMTGMDTLIPEILRVPVVCFGAAGFGVKAGKVGVRGVGDVAVRSGGCRLGVRTTGLFDCPAAGFVGATWRSVGGEAGAPAGAAAADVGLPGSVVVGAVELAGSVVVFACGVFATASGPSVRLLLGSRVTQVTPPATTAREVMAAMRQVLAVGGIGSKLSVGQQRVGWPGRGGRWWCGRPWPVECCWQRVWRASAV